MLPRHYIRVRVTRNIVLVTLAAQLVSRWLVELLEVEQHISQDDRVQAHLLGVSLGAFERVTG